MTSIVFDGKVIGKITSWEGNVKVESEYVPISPKGFIDGEPPSIRATLKINEKDHEALWKWANDIWLRDQFVYMDSLRNEVKEW